MIVVHVMGFALLPALGVSVGVILTGGAELDAQSIVSEPRPVGRPGFVYDSQRSVIVLFGDADSLGTRPGDTWEWNGTSWLRRPLPGPLARNSHGMVYDSRRGVVVLFGGFSDRLLGDTWEFDGATWRKRADDGPGPRAAFGMAYDSARGKAVVFGGARGRGESTLTDTWEWDGTSWSLVATTGPSGNSFLKMAYDANRQRTVAFGGRGGGGETWEWDGRAWMRVSTSGPAPRDHHAMTYDSKRHRILMFGGGRQLPNGATPADTTGMWLRDLWAWDGQQWTQLSSGGVSSRGSMPGFAYDAARDKLVLFGEGNLVGTWLWDGAYWMQAASPPKTPRTPSRSVTGDSTVVAAIKVELGAAYEKYRPAAGLLTRENPLEQPGAAGTEVQAFAEQGRPSELLRVSATTWTPFGKYTVEYFGPAAGPPRFVFESATFRDDAPGRPVDRNFWGQPSWERRYYLETGRVLFTDTIGDAAAPASSAETHARRLSALRALVTTAMASRGRGTK